MLLSILPYLWCLLASLARRGTVVTQQSLTHSAVNPTSPTTETHLAAARMLTLICSPMGESPPAAPAATPPATRRATRHFVAGGGRMDTIGVSRLLVRSRPHLDDPP